MKKLFLVLVLLTVIIGCGKKEVTFEKGVLTENRGIVYFSTKTSLPEGFKGKVYIDADYLQDFRINSFEIFKPQEFVITKNGEFKVPIRTYVHSLNNKIPNGNYVFTTKIRPENQNDKIRKKYGENFEKLEGKFIINDSPDSVMIAGEASRKVKSSPYTSTVLKKQIELDKIIFKNKVKLYKNKIENFYSFYPESYEIREFNSQLIEDIDATRKYEKSYLKYKVVAMIQLHQYSLAYSKKNQKDIKYISDSIDELLNM